MAEEEVADGEFLIVALAEGIAQAEAAEIAQMGRTCSALDAYTTRGRALHQGLRPPLAACSIGRAFPCEGKRPPGRLRHGSVSARSSPTARPGW